MGSGHELREKSLRSQKCPHRGQPLAGKVNKTQSNHNQKPENAAFVQQEN